MRDEPIEESPRPRFVLRMHFEPRVDPRPDEPRPYRALMVRRVARPEIAEVLLLIVRMIRRQRAQPDGREQLLLHHLQHALPARLVQDRIRERDRKELVRTTGRVVST